MTRALIDRLALEEKIDVTGLLVSWRGRGELVAELPAGVTCHPVAIPARLAHSLWQRTDRPAVTGFDVMHGPNFVVPPSPGAAELVTIHDFGPWHFPHLVTTHARAYPKLVKRAVSRGADVHVVSSFVADEAVELLGIERSRVHVIHNGFDPASPGDPARGLTLAGGPYVVAVGTVEPRKDYPTLVAAMDHVRAIVPDMRLVIVGAEGWGSEALDVAIAASHADHVVRMGYTSDQDRIDLLAGASCLAYPSIYEGFGLPPLEAMAQSTPVVASSAGALPEICGGAALLTAPGDSASLARSILDVLTDGSVAEALVRAGRDRIRRYSWDTMTAEMVALYEELAARA